jgi:arsenite methyltransferase
MLPIGKIVWTEARTARRAQRKLEPTEAMDEIEQVRAYVQAYEWGGPTSALQLHHLRELSCLIRPRDTVLDLACGPGPLILELAGLFTETTFIGADLSASMLQHLRQQIAARGLNNVSVLQDDIRTLPSLQTRNVNLVISTSALHHLSDEDALRAVFRRINSLLKPGGGFYMFDFGLLKSREARRLFVAEVAKLAPAITTHDYELSLDAAYPIDVVFAIANEELPRPYEFATSAFVDFFYFLKTPPRAVCPARVQAYIDDVWRSLAVSMKLEHLMLRRLRRKTQVR